MIKSLFSPKTEEELKNILSRMENMVNKLHEKTVKEGIETKESNDLAKCVCNLQYIMSEIDDLKTVMLMKRCEMTENSLNTLEKETKKLMADFEKGIENDDEKTGDLNDDDLPDIDLSDISTSLSDADVEVLFNELPSDFLTVLDIIHDNSEVNPKLIELLLLITPPPGYDDEANETESSAVDNTKKG